MVISETFSVSARFETLLKPVVESRSRIFSRRCCCEIVVWFVRLLFIFAQ